MAKKYLVTLTPDERDRLTALTSAGKRSALTLTRARILLKADQAPGGPAWEDAQIAGALDCGLRTVGDALGAEGVEIGLVGAEQFEVLQACAAGQDVVGDVEDVVGLEVGQVALEQVQVAVDGVGQAQLPDQEVEGTEATGVEAAG